MGNNKLNIGLGTAAIGRPQYINIRSGKKEPETLEEFRKKGLKVLESAYQAGIRYFDTAPGYGMAEQLILDWVREKADDKIEIATKWGYTYVANFDPGATRHEVKEHSLGKLNEQWGQSKKLLPHLSTYQIHSATYDTGVLENEAILRRLFELKMEHGLMIGATVSGDNQVEVLKKAMEVEVENVFLFDAFQVTYNILDQSLSVLLDEMHRNNKRLIIKEALANGRLFPNENYGHYSELYDVLKKMSKKYEVGADALALRFCMESVRPYMILSGASETLHIGQNLKAEKISFEKGDLEKLKGFYISPKKYWGERKKLKWN